MGQRLLITGGSGFIGTHLINAAIEAGDEVLNLDIAAPLCSDHARYWREGDLLDAAGFTALVEEFRPTAIVNLAAIADISFRFEDMPVNTIGVDNIVDAVRATDRQTRIVHVSSQLVVEPGYTPTGPQDFAPYTEYGRTKAASEEILWRRAEEIEWTILRPTNVWGPLHRTFVPSTWKYIQRRWYMLPTGSDPIRSYGYVKNVAEQMLAATRIDPALIDHKVFYVGDLPIHSREWLDGFSYALTGKPVRRVPGQALRVLAGAGEVMKRVGLPAPLDNGRLFRISADYQTPMASAITVLGEGSSSLAQGIAETTAWLRSEFPTMFPRS